MKKFIFTFALMLSMIFSVSVNAQTALQTSKLFDNTYVGVAGGVNTPLSFNQTFPVNTVAGVSVGKYLTPVFGFRVDGTVAFDDHIDGHTFNFVNHFGSKTFVKAVNVGLNGTINLMNLFAGYNGTPRTFEVSTVTGLGWTHLYGTDGDNDKFTSKTGADFAVNFGSSKAWQLYVEPAVVWNLTNSTNDYVTFDKHNAYLQVMAGVNYRFRTSNGTHSFKKYDIGKMNDEINNLRSELAKKPKEVLKVVHDTISFATAPTVVVYFANNSAEITPSMQKVLDTVTNNGAVDVTGFADEYGTIRYNKVLSERRANAVADYLTKNGKTVKTIVGKGETGEIVARVVVISPTK